MTYDHEYEDGAFPSGVEMNQEFEYDGELFVYSGLRRQRVYINITSWRGTVWNATHWHASIRFESVECLVKSTGKPSNFSSSAFPTPEMYQERIDLTYVRETDLVDRLDGHVDYKVGERCTRFESLETLAKILKEEIERLLVGDWEVHYHNRCVSCSDKVCPEEEGFWKRLEEGDER